MTNPLDWVGGGRSVQMERGFWPHDRDPTMEDTGVVWKGYWAVLEGCWAATHMRPLRSPG